MNEMQLAASVINETKKAVIGKDTVLLKVLIAILARGHILLEDIPGVGKTNLALAFSRALGLSYNRVQFNPDVMPSDLTGFTLFERSTGKMEYQKGALLCNLFLADELNRATSRTQSALLEAMEEGQVTVDGVSHVIPDPFLVIATQNPVGASGTQLLPDSQLDRFAMRLSIGYPSQKDEVELLRRKAKGNPLQEVCQVMDHSQLAALRKQVDQVYVKDEVLDYVVSLVRATREHPQLLQGASPRAAISIVSLARAAAFLHGRDFVIPEDVQFVWSDAISHRLLLPSGGTDSKSRIAAVVSQVLSLVPAPRLR